MAFIVCGTDLWSPEARYETLDEAMRHARRAMKQPYHKKTWFLSKGFWVSYDGYWKIRDENSDTPPELEPASHFKEDGVWVAKRFRNGKWIPV